MEEQEGALELETNVRTAHLTDRSNAWAACEKEEMHILLVGRCLAPRLAMVAAQAGRWGFVGSNPGHGCTPRQQPGPD